MRVVEAMWTSSLITSLNSELNTYTFAHSFTYSFTHTHLRGTSIKLLSCKSKWKRHRRGIVTLVVRWQIWVSPRKVLLCMPNCIQSITKWLMTPRTSDDRSKPWPQIYAKYNARAVWGHAVTDTIHRYNILTDHITYSTNRKKTSQHYLCPIQAPSSLTHLIDAHSHT